jgi:hypothetical protein
MSYINSLKSDAYPIPIHIGPTSKLSHSNYETFEDTKGVIRNHKSKDRKYNGQRKGTNNDLQNTTQKTKDSITRILQNKRG